MRRRITMALLPALVVLIVWYALALGVSHARCPFSHTLDTQYLQLSGSCAER